MKHGMGFIVFLFALCPQWVFAAQDKIGPWEKINEKHGIVTYARTNPRVVLKECKAVGLVDATVPELESMMRDYDAYKKILFLSKKVTPIDFPGYKNTADTLYVYLLQGAPWPVDDRDGAGRLDFYVQRSSNTVMMKCQTVIPEYPKTKGVVRLPFCEMEWIFKPVSATTSQVTYQAMIEPGGSISALPTSVIDWCMKYLGTFTVQNMRKVAKQGKYKHAKTIITQTELPENLVHYLE
ncbi:MAG TPA: hypothetical protein PLS21_08235 [Synergistales bacterium]|nr:hypothetical protein [Synergistales bacterium]